MGIKRTLFILITIFSLGTVMLLLPIMGMKTNIREVKQMRASIDFPQADWINSEPLSMNDLKGHVVLFDFWTYCCINCIHVLDDLKYLEDKYKDDAFIVIGIHSPKFANEANTENIRQAVFRYGISHPVLADHKMEMWNTLGVNSWPTFVIMGPDGEFIGKVSGEGQRELLDKVIGDALEEGRKNKQLTSKPIRNTPEKPTSETLSFPGKIALNSNGSILYISDSNHNRILEVKLNGNEGTITNIIGSGKQGFSDGSFSACALNHPQGIALDGDILYIADTENHSIRAADLKKKTVTTIAGTGNQGYTRNYNGPPLEVSLSSPWDIDIKDNKIYIAMAGTHQLWLLDLKKNTISDFTGNGYENITDGNRSNASLAQPSGISIFNDRVYFADSEVSAVRWADAETGNVKTINGRGLFVFGDRDGSFSSAMLQHPLGIFATDDTLFIADTYNHSIRIADMKAGLMSTLIGKSDKNVCSINDKTCSYLPLFEPNDVILYKGKLYIADTNNHLIRIYDMKNGTLEDLMIKSEKTEDRTAQ